MQRPLTILIFLIFMTSNLCHSQETIITKPKKSITKYKTEKPLIVVNDSILKYEVLEFLNPKDIESVTVFKDEKSTELYGEKENTGLF